MKGLILLKGLVALLGLCILGAFAFVVLKITENPPKIKQNLPAVAVPVATPVMPAIVNGLSADETVTQITACAPYVCALVTKPDGARVLVLDIAKGAIIQSIDLKSATH